MTHKGCFSSVKKLFYKIVNSQHTFNTHKIHGLHYMVLKYYNMNVNASDNRWRYLPATRVFANNIYINIFMRSHLVLISPVARDVSSGNNRVDTDCVLIFHRIPVLRIFPSRLLNTGKHRNQNARCIYKHQSCMLLRVAEAYHIRTLPSK